MYQLHLQSVLKLKQNKVINYRNSNASQLISSLLLALYAPAYLEIGEPLSKYRVLKRIAEGGGGTVTLVLLIDKQWIFKAQSDKAVLKMSHGDFYPLFY